MKHPPVCAVPLQIAHKPDQIAQETKPASSIVHADFAPTRTPFPLTPPPTGLSPGADESYDSQASTSVHISKAADELSSMSSTTPASRRTTFASHAEPAATKGDSQPSQASPPLCPSEAADELSSLSESKDSKPVANLTEPAAGNVDLQHLQASPLNSSSQPGNEALSASGTSVTKNPSQQSLPAVSQQTADAPASNNYCTILVNQSSASSVTGKGAVPGTNAAVSPGLKSSAAKNGPSSGPLAMHNLGGGQMHSGNVWAFVFCRGTSILPFANA